MLLHLSIVVRLLVAGALVAFAGGSRLARAQDDDVVDDNPPQPVNAVVQIPPPQIPNFDQMEQWVFGRLGGSAAAHTKLDSALLVRIAELERMCAITEAQENKLRLAGRGDIKRFFDKVAALKQKFQRGPNDPNTNIWQEIQPLQVELNAGLFGDDSIYAKTIRRTLSAEQLVQFESRDRERTAIRFRTTVEWFIGHLDKGLGMSEDQRRQFGELLLKETQAPRKFGQGDYWYVMLQVSRLPEAKLTPILDQPQWRLLSRQFAQAKGMAERLRRAGVISDDDVEVKRAVRDRPIAKSVRLLNTKVVSP